MKRLISVTILLLLSVLLVACLGNDEEADDNLNNNEDATVNDESNQEMNDDGSEFDTDLADAEVSNDEKVVAEYNDESNARPAGQCKEGDLSEIYDDIGDEVVEAIGVELYIPDCATPDGGQESTPPGEWVEYYFYIDSNDFQSIFNSYNDLLADQYDEETSTINEDNGFATFIVFHDNDAEGSGNYNSFSMMDFGDNVYLKIIHFYLTE